MIDHQTSPDETRLFRFIVLNHRSRQFLYVVTMSKIDAVLFDERQLKAGCSSRCYLETDLMKLFPPSHPLNLRLCP